MSGSVKGLQGARESPLAMVGTQRSWLLPLIEQ